MLSEVVEWEVRLRPRKEGSMSILIKGMEMPKNCGECGLESFCNLWTHTDWEKCRHANCPLIELPPHGDLIDKNKLYEKTAEWEAQALHMVEVTMNDEDTTEWRKWSTVLTERSAFKFDIADAPTIIESEGEDD